MGVEVEDRAEVGRRNKKVPPELLREISPHSKIGERNRAVPASLLKELRPTQGEPNRPVPPTFLEKLRRTVRAHLPGRHDQQSHGRRGTSVPDLDQIGRRLDSKLSSDARMNRSEWFVGGEEGGGYPTRYLRAAIENEGYQSGLDEALAEAGVGETVTLRRLGEPRTILDRNPGFRSGDWDHAANHTVNASLDPEWGSQGVGVFGEGSSELYEITVPRSSIVGIGVPAEAEVFVDLRGALVQRIYPPRVGASKRLMNEPTVGHRQPFPHEVQAAVDWNLMQKTWQSATVQLVSQWRLIRAAQAAEIAELVQAAVAAGNASKLAQLTASTRGGDILYAAMEQILRYSARQAVAEAVAQGVVMGALDVEPLLPALRKQADSLAYLAARNVSTTAANQVLLRFGADAADPRAAAEYVYDHILGLSDRGLQDTLGGALTQAQNVARAYVIANGPEVRRIYASEILDQNTCKKCAAVDGKEYANIEEAMQDYPAGLYFDCDGWARCRGTLVAVYDETPATIGDENVEDDTTPDPVAEELDRLVSAHLPGQHDQQSHGRRGGADIVEAYSEQVDDYLNEIGLEDEEVSRLFGEFESNAGTVLYHGSTEGLEPGDIIRPSGGRRRQMESDGSLAYSTPKESDALWYAELAASDAEPAVYEVRAIDTPFDDPNFAAGVGGTNASDLANRYGYVVVGVREIDEYGRLVNAHLPGQHDQQSHGRRGGGAISDWSEIPPFHKGPLTLRGWHVRNPGGSSALSPESEEALGREDMLGPGFYFGPREAVEMYGEPDPVEVSFENPYIMWSPGEEGWDIQDRDELVDVFGMLPSDDYDGIIIPVASIFGVDESQAVLRPGNSDKLRFLDGEVQAHLPGQHDQQSHGNRGGGGTGLTPERAEAVVSLTHKLAAQARNDDFTDPESAAQSAEERAALAALREERSEWDLHTYEDRLGTQYPHLALLVETWPDRPEILFRNIEVDREFREGDTIHIPLSNWAANEEHASAYGGTSMFVIEPNAAPLSAIDPDDYASGWIAGGGDWVVDRVMYDGSLGVEDPSIRRDGAGRRVRAHLPGQHDQKSHGRRGGGISLSESELERVHRQHIRHNLLLEGRTDKLRAAGHSDSSIEEVDRLLHNLGLSSVPQKEAAAEIEQHLRGGTEVGRALESQIELETQLQVEWERGLQGRWEAREENIRWELEAGMRMDFDPQYHDLEAYVSQEQSIFMRENSRLYRKGDVGGNVESWSSLSAGANMGYGNIGYDAAETFEDLYAQGYRVLGGGARMMGAPGEGEITLINLEEIRRVAAHGGGSHDDMSHGNHRKSGKKYGPGASVLSPEETATGWKNKMAERPSEALNAGAAAAINSAPETNRTIYRGDSVDRLEQLGVAGTRGSSLAGVTGQEFELNPSSFSEDADVALTYAESGDRPVLLQVQAPHRSFDMQAAYTPGPDDLFPEISLQEEEWLSGGTFRIVQFSAGNASTDGVPVLQIRQVALPDGTRLDEVRAHLPGQHDQQSHGRRGGSSAILSDGPRSSAAKHAELMEAYSFVHESTGLWTDVRALPRDGPGGVAYGLIYDEMGNDVGSFRREIAVDGDGVAYVHHSHLRINPTYQGQGFATEFNAQAEAWYREAGIQEIRLGTDDVGSYAWAKAGYDWQTLEDASRALDSLEHQDGPSAVLSSWRQMVESGDTIGAPTPLDIAMFGYRPGATTWAGRQALLRLAGGWQGVKVLD